jgi:hypothetical protein
MNFSRHREIYPSDGSASFDTGAVAVEVAIGRQDTAECCPELRILAVVSRGS